MATECTGFCIMYTFKIKHFSCSSQLSMRFIGLLMNFKIPTIVGIITFISRINATCDSFRQEKTLFYSILLSMRS